MTLVGVIRDAAVRVSVSRCAAPMVSPGSGDVPALPRRRSRVGGGFHAEIESR